MLEILQRRLVAGIVRHAEQKAVRGFKDEASLFDREEASVACEGMDDDRCVFPCLRDLVEVADATNSDGTCEGAIQPLGAAGREDVAADEVTSNEILVAGDRG